MVKLAALLLLLINFGASPGPVLVAGGNISDKSIYSRFIQLSKGKVAIVTTASASQIFDVKTWRAAGLTDYTLVGPQDTFPTNINGIWFLGGDQINLENAYIGTDFERKLLQFHRSGGVIAGSSAGCAIMSRVMIRGSKSDQPDIGIGFDIIPDCILDQHFSQRRRLGRLQNACKLHPGLVGIGVDENTAVLYHMGVMQVIGQNKITILHDGKTTEIFPSEKINYPLEDHK
jgi:cyanophycinase